MHDAQEMSGQEKLTLLTAKFSTHRLREIIIQ